MSILNVNSQEWLEWERGDVCCFLCGKALIDGEQVVLWEGCASAEKTALPFAPHNTEELMFMDGIAKAGVGFQKSLSIYFHIGCIPPFCRRILQDWESSTYD